MFVSLMVCTVLCVDRAVLHRSANVPPPLPLRDTRHTFETATDIDVKICVTYWV